jgi:L-alanine-DL-glutamate epimerase-like enolase superfamily enzyme
MFFVEEALGPDCPEDFKALRKTINVPVCGGEIITTSKEMIDRVKNNVYDFVQPDASVIGGISAVMDVFAAATPLGTSVVVHAWEGTAAIMANYHAAFAASGLLVEYPMFSFPLGSEMMAAQRKIIDGKLSRPTASGLGVSLSPDMERRYAFDPSAVYSCALLDVYQPPDSYW